jgi:hypothetical protein
MVLAHRHVMNSKISLAACLVLSATGCVTVRTIPLGGPIGRLPRGCDITVSARPSPAVRDIASIQADCDPSRQECMEELEAKACELGGNEIYAIQSVQNNALRFTATAIVAQHPVTKIALARPPFEKADETSPVAAQEPEKPHRQVFTPGDPSAP